MPEQVDCGFYPYGKSEVRTPHEHDGSFKLPEKDKEPTAAAVEKKAEKPAKK